MRTAMDEGLSSSLGEVQTETATALKNSIKGRLLLPIRQLIGAVVRHL